jgi:hypothetical protein
MFVILLDGRSVGSHVRDFRPLNLYLGLQTLHLDLMQLPELGCGSS